MAKDDIEDFWADVLPKGRKKRTRRKKPTTVTKGQVWVGLFGEDGKELSFAGYTRRPVAIPAIDPQTQEMAFAFSFPPGTVKGVVTSIGVWETRTGDVLIHQSSPIVAPVHITESDTLNLTLTITDSPHPYGGLINMLRMRGLL